MVLIRDTPNEKIRTWMESENIVHKPFKSLDYSKEWEIPFALRDQKDVINFQSHYSFPMFREMWIDIFNDVRSGKLRKFPHGFWSRRQYLEDNFWNGKLRAHVIFDYIVKNMIKRGEDPLRDLNKQIINNHKLGTALHTFYRTHHFFILNEVVPGKYNIWDFNPVPKFTFDPDHGDLDITKKQYYDTLYKRMLVRILKEACRRNGFSFPKEVTKLTIRMFNNIITMEYYFPNVLEIIKYIYKDYFSPTQLPRRPILIDEDEFLSIAMKEAYQKLQKVSNGSIEWIYDNTSAKFLDGLGIKEFHSLKNDSPITYICEIYKHHGIIIQPLYFKWKPLNWFTINSTKGKREFNIPSIREFCFLLAAEMNYKDPKNEFETGVLKYRYGQTAIMYLTHSDRLRSVFPGDSDWISSFLLDYRKQLGLGKDEISNLQIKINNAEANAPETTGDMFLSGKNIDYVVCPDCGKEIFHRSKYRHLRDIHNVRKPIRCQQIENGVLCGERFVNRKDHSHHSREVHFLVNRNFHGKIME